MRYCFSTCILDTTRHVLLRNDEPVKIESQVFDLLHLLVRNTGELITHDQIVTEIWNGRIIFESSISARTNATRKAVGDNGKDQTVTRRGLQLVAPFSTKGKEEPKEASLYNSGQRVRFATIQNGAKLPILHLGKARQFSRPGTF